MSATSKKQYVQKCALFGALTVGLYAAVFTHQDLIMQYFSKGGVYAVLPVLTVFAVSYLHGNFTSSFWSALGIEASKKVGQRVEAPKSESVVTPRPDTRPRLQVNA